MLIWHNRSVDTHMKATLVEEDVMFFMVDLKKFRDLIRRLLRQVRKPEIRCLRGEEFDGRRSCHVSVRKHTGR